MSTNFALRSNKHLFQMLALALCVFAFVGMIMVSSPAIALCEGGDAAATIQSAFSQMTEKIYNVMLAVIIPCCIVALGFAGFNFLFGGNQGAEKARKAVIGVLLAVCFVVFAPMIMNTIGTMVQSSNGSGSSWDDYNPLK